MFHLTFITHGLTACFIHKHLLVLLVTNHVPLPCLWSDHSILPRSTRSFQRSRSRQAEETTLSSSSLFFEQWNKQIPLNLCLFKMIVLIFYHGKLPLNHPLWENVMFLLFPKTTFKQIQVDGRFQTLLQWYVYTQKWRKRSGCLVSNDFCLRPIWCGNLFFFLLVHMEPPPGSKSKMLKWNPTCWNASHHQFATKNLKQQPYVQPKITNQECLKSMGRFFCLNHRSSERLQSTVNTSIINYWTCIFMYKPPKCDFNKGIQPKKFPWSKALGITGTI